MDRIAVLWDLLNKQIDPKVDEKICIPITGGLDSRLIAGIIAQHREIDYGYFFASKYTQSSIPHVEKLMELCRVKKYDIVNMGDITKDKAIDFHRTHAMPDYVIYMNPCFSVLTGLHRTRKKDYKYLTDSLPNKRLVNSKDVYVGWKEVYDPLSTFELACTCLSMSRRERLFQSLHRKMLIRYLPEIANVPRCFEFGGGRPTPIDNDLIYAYSRIRDRTLYKLRGGKNG